MAVDLCNGRAAFKSIFAFVMITMVFSVYILFLKELKVFQRFSPQHWFIEDIVVLTAFRLFMNNMWRRGNTNFLQNTLLFAITIGTYLAWIIFLKKGFQKANQTALEEEQQAKE